MTEEEERQHQVGYERGMYEGQKKAINDVLEFLLEKANEPEPEKFSDQEFWHRRIWLDIIRKYQYRGLL